MSRVGRLPITVPNDVRVNLQDSYIHVKGKLGELERIVPDGITIGFEEKQLVVTRANDSKDQRALHGLMRALVFNMVTGVSVGYTKNLDIVGVGYKVEQRGPAIQLYLGFSHRIIFIAPDGITLKVNSPTSITVSGIDKELVGETAAKIRALRSPEPYKGKGVRYQNEVVRKKAGKAKGK